MKRNMYTPRTPRMAKILSFVLIFVLALSLTSVEALAATYTQEITLRTETIILVDRSGSMKDREMVNDILESVLISAPEATVVYFDSHKLTQDSEYNVGGNSSICEAVDAAARGGFTHIWLISDCEQWPQDYSALGIYANLDVKVCLTERLDQASEKFLEELEDSLVESNLYVYYETENMVEVVLAGYVPETYTIQFEIPEPEIPEPEIPEPEIPEPEITEPEITEPEITEPEITEPETEELDHSNPVDGTAEPQPVVKQTIVQCNHKCVECTHKCLWWLALLLTALFSLLLLLLHWLISHRNRWIKPVMAQINKGDIMIIDVSSSNDGEIANAVRRVEKTVGPDADVIAFAGDAVLCKLSEVQTVNLNRGKTDAVAAIELAERLGYEGTVWFTDGCFNGRTIETNQKRFKRTTMVLSKGHSDAGPSELRRISKRFKKRYL